MATNRQIGSENRPGSVLTTRRRRQGRGKDARHEPARLAAAVLGDTRQHG